MAALPLIELGLRGKLRFNGSNLPENTFNYIGGAVYQFNAGSSTALRLRESESPPCR